MKKILVIGANSAIAQATARRYALQGASLYLLARDATRLATLAGDLEVRGASAVAFAAFEANDFASHAGLLDGAIASLGGLDIALIAHGTLGDQKQCEQDFELALRELNTNAISVISLLTHLGNHFEKQKAGSIAVIGSVAGDRGRRPNYVYGTAKAAVSTFMQGLRSRLYPSGVQVITIKPGFVDTPMTSAFRKGPLWATPDVVAAGVIKAIESGATVVYLPFWWRFIMLIIKAIPERIFRRLAI